MSTRGYSPPRNLGARNVTQQAGALKAAFPDSKVQVKAGWLLWTGELQPSDLSRTYVVQIEYRVPRRPRVSVVSPQLVRDDKGRLPHIYYDQTLCLYDQDEWRPQMLLVDTIVPWASEWLLHYEGWRATHVWHGDGPDSDQEVILVRVPEPKET